MPSLRELCSHIRSKNAGPFWLTIDLFCADRAAFDVLCASAAISPAEVARVYAVPSEHVSKWELAELFVVKLSFPRRRPAGGAGERDVHGGQQYVRLLDIQV